MGQSDHNAAPSEIDEPEPGGADLVEEAASSGIDLAASPGPSRSSKTGKLALIPTGLVAPLG